MQIPSKVKNTKDCESHTVSENVVFEHSDFVTSVAFHPNNEWFVSGCFDKKLRVWSVRDRAVLFWVDLASFITSVALASAGAMVICGDHEGKGEGEAKKLFVARICVHCVFV
jgi:WD40 repeat protein